MGDTNLSSAVMPVEDGALSAEIDRLAKEKSDWMDRLAKHYFPPEIYKLVNDKQHADQLANWLIASGYAFYEDPKSPDVSYFCRTEDGKIEILAEFRIEFRGNAK